MYMRFSVGVDLLRKWLSYTKVQFGFSRSPLGPDREVSCRYNGVKISVRLRANVPRSLLCPRDVMEAFMRRQIVLIAVLLCAIVPAAGFAQVDPGVRGGGAAAGAPL